MVKHTIPIKILNSSSTDWSRQLRLSRRIDERFEIPSRVLSVDDVQNVENVHTTTSSATLSRILGPSRAVLALRLRTDAVDPRLERERRKERKRELLTKTVKTKVVLTPSSRCNRRSARISYARRGRHYALSLLGDDIRFGHARHFRRTNIRLYGRFSQSILIGAFRSTNESTFGKTLHASENKFYRFWE